MNDRYFATDLKPGQRKPSIPQVRIPTGSEELVVEEWGTGFCGAVVGVEKAPGGLYVRLEDAQGTTRLFPMRPGGFAIDGVTVTLLPPLATPQAPKRSQSGSTMVQGLRAKVARGSRIWVEGVHDAALVEKVWGHDLRVEGVVVEQLEGLDNLPERLAHHDLSDNSRIGVLADHLIEGSKETRLTQSLGPYVMVTGHPYVDIWQAVKPQAVGIPAWPVIERGKDWKTAVCHELGWKDPRAGWQKVISSVHSFRDLESTLLGAVERLIDFVTEPPA